MSLTSLFFMDIYFPYFSFIYVNSFMKIEDSSSKLF